MVLIGHGGFRALPREKKNTKTLPDSKIQNPPPGRFRIRPAGGTWRARTSGAVPPGPGPRIPGAERKPRATRATSSAELARNPKIDDPVSKGHIFCYRESGFLILEGWFWVDHFNTGF